MTVYPVEAEKASCRVSGCLCHARVPRYPSDLTDAEWELLRPEAQAVMAQLRRSPAGRLMGHDLRAVLDAVRYVSRYGIEWRALPVDLPPWEAVYAFFERWNACGLPQVLVDRLRGRLRVAWGRAELPTAGSIDSQSVKAADTVGAASGGFDGGKKINGRKRHGVVDSLGLVLAVLVTAASVQDRDGAFRLLTLLRERFSTITLIWADGGNGALGHRRHHDPATDPHDIQCTAPSPMGPAPHHSTGTQTARSASCVTIYQQALR